MLKALRFYNNTFHSTIKATPQDVQEHRVDHNAIRDRLEQTKQKIIGKRNESREEYTEDRDEGFIKNYKSLRHKEQPKYRKHKLKDIHESNIKRSFKFSAAPVNGNHPPTSSSNSR